MTKLKYTIKTLVVIFFIFVFNLNTALSSEPDNKFFSAAEIKEFQSNGFLKSKFFVESMNKNKNRFILKGKLKTNLIAKVDMPSVTKAPVHIELIFADSSLLRKLANNNPSSNCILTGTISGELAHETAIIQGEKLICNNGTEKKKQNIHAFVQDNHGYGLKGTVVTLGKKDLTKDELALIEKESSEFKQTMFKQAFEEQASIFVAKDTECSITIILQEQNSIK